MARIIKIDKDCEKKVTHKKCGAVIGYFQTEVQSFIHYDYGGGSDTVYYITCPKCGDTIPVGK